MRMRRTSIFATAAGVLGLAAAPGLAQTETVQSSAGPITVETLASGLEHPWGMAFLPDGRILVTERVGDLRILTAPGELSEPLEGVPAVLDEGQGGLLDIAIDPDFASNSLVWLSFAEPGDGGASTALGRGRLQDGRIEGFEVVFRQEPKVSGSKHFGGRIVFAGDGRVFLTLGERFKFDPAQDLTSHLGAIVRINRDGSAPEDNPFVGQQNAKPEIWSYGHRNIESAAFHPETGELWVAEMGPQGGDELNLPQPGRNYGWPVVSWGENYDGTDIPDPPTRPEFADAIKQWTPVISPSGMVFYTGEAFSEWRGSMLIGGLTSSGIVRVTLDGQRVAGEERIPMNARIRDVAQGPDGAVYVLTDEDDGKLCRLTPER